MGLETLLTTEAAKQGATRATKAVRNVLIAAGAYAGIRYLGKKGREIYLSLDDNVKDVLGTPNRRMRTYFESISDSELNRLATTVYDTAGSGLEVVTGTLREQQERYSGYLGEQVENHPRKVGFWDGYLNSFLGSDCSRSPDKSYKRAVPVGKGVGVVVGSLIPAGRIAMFLRALPHAIMVRKVFKDVTSASTDDGEEI